MARPPAAPAPVPVVALPVGRVDLKAVEEAQKKAQDELGNVGYAFGNQTWLAGKWTIEMKPSIYRGFSIAMFDYQRVCLAMPLKFLTLNPQKSEVLKFVEEDKEVWL